MLRTVSGSAMIACAIAVFLTTTVGAQEFDVLDVDDFIDPRDLQTTFLGEDAPSTIFNALQYRIGAAGEYHFQNTFTNSPAQFAQVVWNCYRRRSHYSVELRHIRSDHFPGSYAWRYGLRVGKSFPWAEEVSESGYLRRSSGRLVFGMGQLWDGAGPAGLEYGGVFSVRISDRWSALPLVASVFYTRNVRTRKHYAGLGFSRTIAGSATGPRLVLAFRVAREHEELSELLSVDFGNRDRINVFRISFALEVPVAFLDGQLHLSYAPGFDRRTFTANQEIAVFITGAVFTKLN